MSDFKSDCSKVDSALRGSRMQRKWKDTSGRAAYILYVKGQSTSCPIYGCPPTAEGKWFLDYLKDKNVKQCKIIIRKKKE